MLLFGDVELFLHRNDDVGAASRQKLLAIFQDPQKAALLKIELASIIDWGEAFVKATYNLEGDGPLAFTCYEIVQTVVASIQVANTPNVNAVAKSLAPVPVVQQLLVTYAKSCVQPGLDYFQHQLQTSLKVPLAAFKAARFFSPCKITHLKPSASEVDALLAFPFLSSTNDLVGLKGELATYLANAEGVDPSVDCLDWWRQNAVILPAWAAAARKVLVVQPSSAAASEHSLY